MEAIRGVDCDVAAGEFLALTGPSGCGKSTFLHIAGAMDRPSHGSVRLAGQRLDQLDERDLALVRRSKVGFVFQFFNLLPTLRAVENVALPLILAGTTPTAARQRATDLLASVGLADYTRRFPSELSGGELQRVAIARAIANDPVLLLADEPTGSLDSVNSRVVLELLEKLNRESKVTIVLATHDREVAATASRNLRMRDGRFESSPPSVSVPR